MKKKLILLLILFVICIPGCGNVIGTLETETGETRKMERLENASRQAKNHFVQEKDSN